MVQRAALVVDGRSPFSLPPCGPGRAPAPEMITPDWSSRAAIVRQANPRSGAKGILARECDGCEWGGRGHAENLSATLNAAHAAITPGLRTSASPEPRCGFRDGDGRHSLPEIPMSREAATSPHVFPTWAELAAAAKAGDARAHDFLLTFVPWMTALRDDQPKR